MPVGITWLGGDLFRNCENLTTVKFNAAVTLFGKGVFAGSPKVTFEIADGVAMTTSGGALYSGTKLLGYGGGSERLTVADGTTEILRYAFSDIDTLRTIELPDTVTSIAERAFMDCYGLETINLENVDELVQYAFLGATGLTSVKLKNSTVAKAAFQDCTSLESVEFLGENVTIGESAFKGCTALREMIGQDKVTSIGAYAFQNAIQTTETELNFSNAKFLGTTGYIFNGATKLTAITIKGVHADNKGVETKKIPAAMFDGCTSLADVTVVESVESIDNYAFRNCTALNFDSIDFGEVTKIGSNVFQNCEKMTAIALPKLTSLGSTSTLAVKITANVAVFSGCTRLTTVSLGSGVTVLGKNVFFNCSALTTVLMPGVTQIGQYAFAGCSGLTSLVLTSAVTAVDANAFDGWLETQTINLPDYEEGNLPSDWNAAWNAGCNAKIVYKKAQATA